MLCSKSWWGSGDDSRTLHACATPLFHYGFIRLVRLCWLCSYESWGGPFPWRPVELGLLACLVPIWEFPKIGDPNTAP